MNKVKATKKYKKRATSQKMLQLSPKHTKTNIEINKK
jgi:hypothetical protein